VGALVQHRPAEASAWADPAHRVRGQVPRCTPCRSTGRTQITLCASDSGWFNIRDRDIQAGLRAEHLTAPAQVAAEFAATTSAAVGLITELNRQITELEAELATHFETHLDADIYRSLPGLGVKLGARVLGEFGDDPDRYTTTKSRRNYAGTSTLN
jgi:transposase